MDKKFLTTVILVILTIVIIFTIVGTTAPTITDSGDSITDANNCSLGKDNTGTTLTYNITDKYCYNSTTGQTYVALQYNLPLNTLFSSGGVVLLILMAAIFLSVIGIVFFKSKK